MDDCQGEALVNASLFAPRHRAPRHLGTSLWHRFDLRRHLLAQRTLGRFLRARIVRERHGPPFGNDFGARWITRVHQTDEPWPDDVATPSDLLLCQRHGLHLHPRDRDVDHLARVGDVRRARKSPIDASSTAIFTALPPMKVSKFRGTATSA